jgi:VWFA-related protein
VKDRAALLLFCALIGGAAPAATDPPDSGLREEVEVNRVQVEVRVTGKPGEPLLDLGAEDFVVRLGGMRARVEAVDWIGGRPVPLERGVVEWEEVTEVAERGPAQSGRLIVLLFQRDLQDLRIKGLAKIKSSALDLVRGLAPGDRVAVLCFQSHLEIFSDFTTDHQRVIDVIDSSIVRHRPPPPLEPGLGPALADHLTVEQAAGAATPEDALVLIAEALERMPGSKSLIFFAWGIGRKVGDSVVMHHNYPDALERLVDGRTTVFSIDVTQADYHTLEGPLVRIARDTGGFYAKTLYVPHMAVEQVADALASHYLLTVIDPGLDPGPARLRVRLAGRGGVVYHREFLTIE